MARASIPSVVPIPGRLKSKAVEVNQEQGGEMPSYISRRQEPSQERHVHALITPTYLVDK